MPTAFVPNSVTDHLLRSFYLFNAEAGTAAVFKMMLLGSGYVPNKTHKFVSDIVAHEISGSGYTAGGKVVTITIGTSDNTLNETRAQCSGVSWPNSTISAKVAAVYKVKAGNSTHQIAGFIVFDTVLTTTGTELIVGPFEFPARNLGTLPA